jgi:hypothetical protein
LAWRPTGLEFILTVLILFYIFVLVPDLYLKAFLRQPKQYRKASCWTETMLENTKPDPVSQNPEEFLVTTYREDLDILVCRWSGLQDSKHLRNCYRLIFNKAKDLQYHCWLIDIRGRDKASQEDFDWYFTTFLPEEVAGLQGRNFLAYLVTPSHYNYIQEMETFNKFEKVGRVSSLSTRFFQSEQEAIDWLVASRL